MDLQRQLLAAQGYSELGMPAEALAELDALGPARQGDAEVLNARLFVLMKARRWPEALAVAEALCARDPGEVAGFIHAAFCLHELGRTREARDRLLSGPVTLRQEATFHYNLGCYEAVLGNPEAARAHLLRSFEIDRKFRSIARLDPDLASHPEWLP